MPDDHDLPEGVPPATGDIGLPTPPSHGRLPPLDLPPPPPEGEPASDRSGGGDVPEGER